MTGAIVPVILCGGSGTRLWPLSRGQRPKQLLSLTGETSLLQQALARVADPGRFAPALLVGGAGIAEAVAEQARGHATGPLILEPAARNTAAAIALAAHEASRDGADPVLLVMPSDHVIADVPAFLAAVDAGRAAAEAGRLVTFGIKPDAPETGYGYLKMAAGEVAPGVRALEAFVEKPDAATAARYVADPAYAWNAGIFMFGAGRFLAELAVHEPAIAAAAKAAMAQAERRDGAILPEAQAFTASPNISVDYAVMEKTDGAAAVPVDMGWSDVGSWDALWAILPKDAAGNALRGAALIEDCAGNLIVDAGGPLVSAIGLSDMVVVSTPDAVTIIPRARSQEVRTLVERLKRDRPELL